MQNLCLVKAIGSIGILSASQAAATTSFLLGLLVLAGLRGVFLGETGWMRLILSDRKNACSFRVGKYAIAALLLRILASLN
jgi:hypothetical protein